MGIITRRHHRPQSELAVCSLAIKHPARGHLAYGPILKMRGARAVDSTIPSTINRLAFCFVSLEIQGAAESFEDGRDAAPEARRERCGGSSAG